MNDSTFKTLTWILLLFFVIRTVVNYSHYHDLPTLSSSLTIASICAYYNYYHNNE